MEFTRYGDGYLKRASVDHDWEPADESELSEEFLTDQKRRDIRREVGSDPWRPDPPANSVVTGVGRAGAVRLANPKVDAIAEELGLSPDELRERVNGKEGGTRVRVEEARFDKIAKTLGLDPEVARNRFADRPDDFVKP